VKARLDRVNSTNNSIDLFQVPVFSVRMVNGNLNDSMGGRGIVAEGRRFFFIYEQWVGSRQGGQQT